MNCLYKVPCHLKAAVSDALPEVVVLAGFIVFERNIADNSEGNERGLIDVADLRNRTTLHVDGCCFWEVIHDLLHLLT